MKKRLLAMLMVLSMALSILPMSAMAAPDDGSGGQDETSQVVNPGGTIYYDKDGKKNETGELGKDGIVVEMKKEVEKTEKENEFNVTLQVRTSQNIKELSSKNPDAAVVLVLDVSNSMDNCSVCGNSWYQKHKGHRFTSRLAKAKEAAIQFVDEFAKLTAGEGTAKRMVNVIMFGDGAYREVDWCDVTKPNVLQSVKTKINSLETSGGTNIEAGLMLARNNLDSKTVDGIDYLYTILLTDGEPTMYVDGNRTSVNRIDGNGLGYGATEESVKDIGTLANNIKEKGNGLSKLYSICCGEDVWNSKPFHSWSGVTPSVTEKTTIGEWLQAFSTAAYKSDSADNLFDNFSSILEQIKIATKAFRVSDHMGETITAEQIISGGKNVAEISDNEVKWNILASEVDETLTNWNEETNTGILGYSLAYTVTLDNLSMKNIDSVVAVNEEATLTYAVQNDGTWGDIQTGTFAVPQVKSFAGDLIFTKKGSDGKILEGARFTLTCQDNGNWNREATSNESGEISFENIPSGHVYTLTEAEVPEGYVAVEPIDVTVSYGEVTAEGITDGTLIDPVATGSLAISKTVTAESGLEPDSDQKFTFMVDFNGEDVLEGKFPYTVSGSETGNGNVTDGATITLKAEETATITGLPVGTTYTVTETNIPAGFVPENNSLQGSISKEESKAVFTNTYTVTPATLLGETCLTVKKEIKAGDELYTWGEDDSFTFSISAKEGTPMPNEKSITIGNGTDDYTASFGNITYEKPGTYEYNIRENSSNIPGMSSDTKVYIVTVNVEVQDGKLVPKVTYRVQQGDKSSNYTEYDTNKLLFTNLYDTSRQTVRISGNKELKGEPLDTGDFQFQLIGVQKDDGKVIRDQSEVGDIPLPGELTIGGEVSNGSAQGDPGNIFFGTITYDVQDAGTYKYYFQEVVPEDKEPGMVYDEEEKVVTVTVTYDEGVLNATVSVDTGDGTAAGESASLTFRNVKKKATLDGDKEAALTVKKTLTGRGWLPTDQFTFQLAAEDDDTSQALDDGTVKLENALGDVMVTTIPESKTIQAGNSVISNTKTGSFGDITFYEAGTYTFTVTEIKPDKGAIEGVTYSLAKYTVTVQVDENKDGTLAEPKVTVTQTTDDKGESVSDGGATTPQFTNTVAEKGNTKSVTTGTEGTDSYDPDGKVAGVGDILTYTIQWVNDAVDENGNATAATVTVTDTIPEGTEYVKNSAVNATYDDTTKTLTWTINNAAADATDEVSFQVKVTEAAVENKENTIKNQAAVKVGDNTPKQTTETETYVPEKSVTEYQPGTGDAAATVPDTGLKVGDQLTYTIFYKNTETDKANVTIADVVPAGTKLTEKPMADGATVTMYADDKGETETNDPAAAKMVKWVIPEVEENAEGTVTMTVKVVSGAEATVENTASVQIGQDGPTVSTNTESTEIDESERTVTITPADIIVYTGGTGYEGVVGNQSGAARAGEDEETGGQSNGLPEPGYYITLPDWLNDQLNIQDDPTEEGATDLSKILTFTYADDEEQTREWSLALYYDGEDGTSYEETRVEGVTRNRYVYRMNPAVVDGEKIPVRVQFVPKNDPDGIPTLSDDFTLDLGTLYQQYSMTIYPGLLEQDLVEAQVKLNGEDDTETLPVKVGNGTLTVRGTTNGEVTTKVATTTDAVAENENTIDDVTGCTITAVADADTQYVVNESHVTVEAENVHLLADELSQGDTAEGDAANESQQILKNYLVKKDQAETDDHYIYQYLDLVDETNGRAWVTADRPVDVYWKLPKGSDSNDDFKLVHFTGLDRQYDEETEGLIGQEGYEVEAYTTSNGGLEIVTLDGEQYLKFATKEFSPFVLVWDEVSNSSGGGNKPSLNTEDHYGYIVGYPVDYETGEPTDDQARKPVKPQGKITRAEVATIFFRMLTDESRNAYWSQSNSFTDVAADAWYNNAISTMTNAGILDGYEDGSFHPNGYITRAEFATIAVRFFDLSYQGEDLFPDIDGHWAQDYINQAADAGIIEGYPDGTFGPQKQITRAEAVTMVNRTLDRHPDPDHFLEDMLVWPDNLDTEAWYYADMQEATNSHEYQMKKDAQGNEYEVWTKILPIRDWEALEKEWSDANSSENPGDVAG